MDAARQASRLGVIIRTERAAGAFVLIVLIGVGIPLLIRARIGVIPNNDEWSFAKAALAMHAHHEVALQGFNQMFLVGQLVAAQPFLYVFGAHVASLAVFGATAAVLWMWTAFALARPMIGTPSALVLVGVLAASPSFGLLSSSFMTDVPSTAAALLALYVGIRAFETATVWRLLIALVLGVVAFTFREQAVVVFVTFLASAWLCRSVRTSFRVAAGAGTVLCVLSCFVLEQLRHGLPHGDNPPFGLDSIDALGALDSLTRGMFTVALALSPLTILRLIRRGRRRPGLGTVLGWSFAAIATCDLIVVEPHSVLLGNYVDRHGAFPTAMVGLATPAFGPIAWFAVQSLAIVSTIVMCGEMGAFAQRWRPRTVRAMLPEVRRFMVYLYGVGLSLVYVGLAFIGQTQYDRYVIPLLPTFGVLLLRGARAGEPSARSNRSRRLIMLAPALCLALVLATSLSLTLTTYVRDQTVWRSALRLTAHGVAATAINAGSDWDGMHAATPLDRSGVHDPNLQYPGDMWAQRFPGSGDCYAVTVSRLPRSSWRLVYVAQARPYGTSFGAAAVYTYRRTDGKPFGNIAC
jgi:hypothetical protein